ncbi:hypothetical protein Angca_000069 [Angiostrongylus cantonensis]|nr:hypothetical protein Angca_000069 [Angiostrongylus cantonensis]
MNAQQHQRSDSDPFIPPVFASLNIKPEHCKLVVNYEKSLNRTRFTFSVSWTEKNQERVLGDNSLVLSVREPVDEKSFVVRRRTMPTMPTDEMITCDGPCGHTYSPKAMNVLGRCGHFLCNNCHGLVYNDDGTKGCSNFQCVFATLYDYLPEDSARKAYENQIVKRQRARDMQRDQSTSLKSNDPLPSSSIRRRQAGLSCTRTRRKPASSSSGDAFQCNKHLLKEIFSDTSLNSRCQEVPSSEFELLNIRLMIFEPGPFKTIRRIHICHEMPASLTLKEAIDELVEGKIGAIRHECPSRLFLCTDKSSGGLRKISVEEFETALLWQYPARNSTLHFVLDAVGYLKSLTTKRR